MKSGQNFVEGDIWIESCSMRKIYIEQKEKEGKVISSWQIEGTVYTKYSRATPPPSILKIIDFFGYFLFF